MDHISNIYTQIFAYFHHVIKCGIIFGGNSSNSGKIFTLQKKIVRIIANQSCFQKGTFYAGIKSFNFTI